MTADEMFARLGYYKEYDDYYKNEKLCTYIIHIKPNILKNKVWYDGDINEEDFTKEEVNAVVQAVKEMGGKQ